MSAQIDTIFDQLSAASNQKNSQAKGTKGTGDSVVFADLLQDSLPSNITFTRPGSQLSLPEGSQPDEFDFANNDNQYYDNAPAAEANDANDDYDQHAEDDTPDRHDNSDSDEPRHEDSNAYANPAIANGIADKTAPTVTSDGAATNNGNANNAEKANAHNAGQQAAQSSKGAQGEVAQTETADIDPATLQKKQGNNSGVKVTVTDKADPLTSQPSNVLSANSAVAAQSTQQGPASDTTTVADMLLETSEEATLTNAGGNANDAKGNNGSSNNNAGQNPTNQQAAAQANVTPNANDAATAAVNPTAAAKNAATPVATPTAARSAAPMAAEAPSSVFGNPGQIASVDSASGGIVTEGQNGQTTQKTAAPAQAAPQSRPSIPPQLVSDQVSVNIQRAAGQGQDKISIQLRPYELGKIDVTMEMAKDGKMTAVITAEKQETLDMLKNDSSSLIQSLNDAGMQTDSSSLSFNLDNKGSTFGQFANGSDSKKEPEKEFSLETEEAADDEGKTSNMLGLGEEAQADENGHYDIQV